MLTKIGSSTQIEASAASRQPLIYAGVFDGHGGYATSDWLEKNLFKFILKYWQDGQNSEYSLTEAFLKVCSPMLQIPPEVLDPSVVLQSSNIAGPWKGSPLSIC